ncbi:efflux RND transporter periplasmic adaptor subunit [Metallibacterium sp.]|uniref:efflux RND transporter periplasmic adaptor subunit n=1 Tax=Metallibacterium sp. TaxID=2940281 RepID=UPI00262E3844|nr:efflux RND transporter periplasmic adaptor subunit [Metallibacterium sp.]
MTGKRKGLIAAGIVAAGVILVLIGVAGHRDDGPKVEVSKVEPRTVRSSILAGGVMNYLDPVELKPQVIGRIIAIPVKEGQRVTAGEVVLRLDPRVYQAAVQQAQASVQQAQTAIESQRLTMVNLEQQVARQRALFKRGLVDANSYDNLQNTLAIARVQLQSQRESLNIAQAQLSQARETLAKTVIRTPINGVVTSLPVKVGETVIAGTNIPGSTMMSIANPAQIIADVQVDEADIAHVKPGTEADLHAVSFPHAKLKGKVIFIASSVTPNLTTATAGRNFEVKIALQGKDLPHILPGMSCRAEIFTRSAPNALAVPVQAVLYEDKAGAKNLDADSGAYVFVMKNGKVQKAPVTTGLSSDTWQAISKGLQAGEQVVSGPYQTLHALTAGEAVQIEKPKPAAAKPKDSNSVTIRAS